MDPAVLIDSADTGAPVAAHALQGSLGMSVLASGLSSPFEMIAGPDGYLWVTMRSSGEVTRVSTVDGSLQVALELTDLIYTAGAQDGLMGMALHPKIATGSPYVYIAYTYDANADVNLVDERVKIVRYTYDSVAHTLASPLLVLGGIPGGHDHNAGRLLFGPDSKLYYAVGDQGNNQFDRACYANLAQTLPTKAQILAKDLTAYQGKVLRINLNGSIPASNPVFNGVRSHILTVGHRNPQGLAFGADGTLYSSEQGPKTDDEINILISGKNYGWPKVAGYQDGMAYTYANWSASVNPPCSDLVYSDIDIPPSVPQTEESAFSSPVFQPPARTFYTVADTYNFEDPACAADGLYFICWPTIAASSIAVYEGRPNGIPGLDGSLLITSLKLGSLYRVDLHDAAGVPIPDNGDAELLYSSVDRYRRVTPSRNGKLLYVATDVSGIAMGADGSPTFTLEHPGSILVLSAGL